MIAGLEELVLRCTDDNGRANIREAVKCYEGGAYRAAIITAYVAVCFDLIEKLRILSSLGDSEAKRLVTTLDNLHVQRTNSDPKALPGLLEFERMLLEVFRDKFDFFGAHEFEDLSRLRQDRNRCAHPSFSHSSQPYSPNAELARFHIFNAITLVLSQHPRQGKAALDSLRAVILSQNFPNNPDGVFERLKGSELSNGRDNLITSLIDELAFGWPNATSPYHKSPAVVNVLIATVEIKRPIAIPRLTKAVDKLLLSPDVEAVRFGAVLALRVPEIGEVASNPSRAVLKQWLQNPETLSRANAIRLASRISWLKETAITTAATLTATEVGKASGEVVDPVVARGISLFARASSWSEANTLAPKVVLPYVDRIDRSQIEEVLKSAHDKSADLVGSGGFKQFIQGVNDKNPIGHEELCELLIKYELEFYISDLKSSDPDGSDELSKDIED